MAKATPAEAIIPGISNGTVLKPSLKYKMKKKWTGGESHQKRWCAPAYPPYFLWLTPGIPAMVPLPQPANLSISMPNDHSRYRQPIEFLSLCSDNPEFFVLVQGLGVLEDLRYFFQKHIIQKRRQGTTGYRRKLMPSLGVTFKYCIRLYTTVVM